MISWSQDSLRRIQKKKLVPIGSYEDVNFNSPDSLLCYSSIVFISIVPSTKWRPFLPRVSEIAGFQATWNAL